MAFGWFAKGKKTPAKSLQKAHKLVIQARWAEALSYYEEVAADPELATQAQQGARACREKLVQWNLEEAESFLAAEEPERAREHVQLALELAAGEEDLAARVRSTLEVIGSTPEPQEAPAPGRLFEPGCGCGSPCPSGAGSETDHTAGEELFEFYLDSLTDAERDAFEPLGTPFRSGFVLLQQGETDAARPLLEAAAAERPDLPGPTYALGLLAAIEGDGPQALQHFEGTLAIAADFAPAAHHLADLMRESGRSSDAAEFLADWCRGHSGDTEALYLLAACRAEGSDPAGALQALELADEAAPGFQPRLQILRAAILQRQGDADGALKAYQAVVARNPDLLEALVPLGQILLHKGGASAEGAAEVFKHCRRLDPQRGWWHLLRIAEAYDARGWRQEARDLLATARDELPDAPEPRAEWEGVRKRLGVD